MAYSRTGDSAYRCCLGTVIPSAGGYPEDVTTVSPEDTDPRWDMHLYTTHAGTRRVSTLRAHHHASEWVEIGTISLASKAQRPAEHTISVTYEPTYVLNQPIKLVPLRSSTPTMVAVWCVGVGCARVRETAAAYAAFCVRVRLYY